MADQNVLSSMGFNQDNTDPNAPPPTDAHLVMGYFGKVMAKQRWGKANKAISALGALKKAGGLAALAQAQLDAEARSDRPCGRVSITALAADPGAGAVTSTMNDVPSDADLAEMLSKLKGNFSCVLIEQAKNFMFAARSEGSSVPLYWGHLLDGSVMFASAIECFPEEAAPQEFPAGYMYCGRCGESVPPKAYKDLEGGCALCRRRALQDAVSAELLQGLGRGKTPLYKTFQPILMLRETRQPHFRRY